MSDRHPWAAGCPPTTHRVHVAGRSRSKAIGSIVSDFGCVPSFAVDDETTNTSVDGDALGQELHSLEGSDLLVVDFDEDRTSHGFAVGYMIARGKMVVGVSSDVRRLDAIIRSSAYIIASTDGLRDTLRAFYGPNRLPNGRRDEEES